MSLGVLNNLAATYAENNLNNTTNSLNTVLQQLSSGSKINSGADDAAGLSLVDGLQANSQALAQSKTNAQEGVGLLQVADGALSQVTSLLNRAVTLATEASNGTLSGSQDTAANQEYQSILSEISIIGTTTTYNQQSVFGTSTNIYTGDSTATGASVNDLNIGTLSSSDLGDTNGVMAYSNGQGGVFINLSKTGDNASVNDSFSNGTAAGITVTTLSKGAYGTVQPATTNITAGGTGTVNDLINAINANTTLGLHASFTTEAAAGVTGGTGSFTGIEITGAGTLGKGSAPGELGEISAVSGASTDTFNANSDGITITTADGKQHDVAVAANATIANMATTINGMNLGVTAKDDGSGNLVFTSANSSVQVVSSLYDNTASNTGTVAFSAPAGTFYTVGIQNGSGGAAVVDSATGNTAGGYNLAGKGGTATISYSDNAGQSLSSTDLSNQADAELTLTSLNSAIVDVAAQDGYVGAQINTLNAASQVLSTQAENVTSAQNAVQATDYASATSAMSKYEILSQTGISALAQANSMSQEVTKLLQ
jgi:flagellin